MTALKAINLEDFRKNCQYAQMYIERQNRLPAEAYKAINIRPLDNPNLNQLVWRHFYKTRSEAARNYKANISDEDLKISPWLRLLSYLMLQKTVKKIRDANNFPSDRLVEQHMEYENEKRLA